MPGMQDELEKCQRELKAEADRLLYDAGVLAFLKRYGQPHLTGSYALDLMTWRDLDIYLEAGQLPVECFLQLGVELVPPLRPWKMWFSNHRDFPTAEGIAGLYYGLRLGPPIEQGAWKIDLWAIDSATCARRMEETLALAAQLTPATRRAILQIKTALWNHPEYRKSITSQQIYQAVLHMALETPSSSWPSDKTFRTKQRSLERFRESHALM